MLPVGKLDIRTDIQGAPYSGVHPLIGDSRVGRYSGYGMHGAYRATPPVLSLSPYIMAGQQYSPAPTPGGALSNQFNPYAAPVIRGFANRLSFG
jgi:hypothetical protein